MRILKKHKVKYLIVGAYAVIYYTEPRYTKDLDIWIRPDLKNAQRVYEALKEFGAPLKGITIKDFTNKNLFYQLGVVPIRVDIMMGIKGLDFDLAWRNKKTTNFEGIKVNIIGINELISSKLKLKRPLDQADIEALKFKLKISRRR
ncbi:MAG: hypothetical protein NC900_00490 [Candidatus Omnitrophica bacterium]|nr:hypothetical protein [Candidatus Omnitrophota bacterium]